MQDDRTVKSTLKKIFLDQESVFAWKLENSQIIRVDLKPVALKTNSMTFKINNPKEDLLALINERRELKIYSEKNAFFMLCRIIEFSDNELRVEKPKLYNFEDRRLKKRSDELIALTVKMATESNALLKNCVDFGPGGFSVVLMKSEANPFKVDDKAVNVEILPFEISCKALLIKTDYIKPFEYSSTPYGGRRLAFKFIEMDNKTQSAIDSIFMKAKKSG